MDEPRSTLPARMRHLDPNNQYPLHSEAWTKANEEYAAESFRRTGERPGCFPAGTPVRTPWGERAIESLAVGDEVLARGADGGLRARRVHRVPAPVQARVRRIHWASGQPPLATTRHHAFLTARGWVRCADMGPGDRVVRAADHVPETSMAWSEVERIDDCRRAALVFNLIIERDLTYVAGGCLVHCFGYWRSLRTLVHRLELLAARGLGGLDRGANTARSKLPSLRTSPNSARSSTLTHQLPAL